MTGPERYSLPVHHRSLLLLLLFTACGEPAGPGSEAPALTAINGAALPLIAVGDTLALEGSGFGPAQGDGSVMLGETSLPVLSWEGTTIVAVAATAAAGSLRVTTASGALIDPLPVRVLAPDTVTTDARPWTAGPDLPVVLPQAAAAGIVFPTETGYTSVVVVSGGRRADGTLTDSTRIGTTEGTSTATSWASAPDLIVPRARRLHAMVGASGLSSRLASRGVAWMIGGVDSAGRTLADVLGVAIGVDGSYESWTVLTPMLRDRAGVAATVGLGTIYVVGGFGSDLIAQRDVILATINVGGTINGWFRGPDLPVGLAYAAAVVVGDRLYVVGGETGSVDPDTSSAAGLVSTVYSLRLSRRTGFVADSAWTTETSTLVHARARHALYAAAGGLVVVGGVLADSAASDTESARRVAGTLNAFQDRTAAARPGGPTRDFAAPLVRDATGRAIISVLAGTDSSGGTPHLWWH